MTADDWDKSADLDAMLALAVEPLPPRKLLLLNAAFARRVARFMPDDATRGLIELTERRADGLVNDAEWRNTFSEVLDPYLWGDTFNAVLDPQLGNEAARDGAGGAVFSVLMNMYQYKLTETRRVAASVVRAREYLAYHSGYPATLRPEEWVEMAARTEAMHLCELTRCIVGNPYRPTAIHPDWLTSTVVALARGIYDERAYDRLPILADALQDAGCDDEYMLAHCRGDGPHARGCWVVDAAMGIG